MIPEFRLIEFEEADPQKMREAMRCSCASGSTNASVAVARQRIRSVAEEGSTDDFADVRQERGLPGTEVSALPTFGFSQDDPGTFTRYEKFSPLGIRPRPPSLTLSLSPSRYLSHSENLRATRY